MVEVETTGCGSGGGGCVGCLAGAGQVGRAKEAKAR